MESIDRPAKLLATLPPSQAASLAWLLAPVFRIERPPLGEADVFAASWRSHDMARFAAQTASTLAGDGSLGDVQRGADGEVRCVLHDRRGRHQELLATFESPSSGRLTRVCVRPVRPDLEVRPLGTDDLGALAQLELSAPVQREDGSEVIIDHSRMQLEQSRVVSDHRWLAAFENGRMVAVQGVALVTAPIGGVTCRIAYNHYSRSDPRTRQSGNHLHLVMTLYRDVFPEIDQFLSLVDVHNPTGLRLSFGTPWPTRVRRLFLSVADLARRGVASPPPRAFEPAHAATLLNVTHSDMNLWVPRTAKFLTERCNRAPAVHGPSCWRLTDRAALAVWPSGERRSYRQGGQQTVRSVALVLDYGFAGERGREELTGLLCRAAGELLGQGISHLAIFVSDDHPPTEWLADLAETSDTYAVCAPVLTHPAPPTGPVYVDHIIF